MKSTLLDNVTHGFSTIKGGVSVLPYTKTMNLGFGREDEEITLENRRRFSAACGVNADNDISCRDVFISAKQIHSNKVIFITEENGRKWRENEAADGFYTCTRGIPIGVKAADCCPILLYDEDVGVVAAVHAGWRGAAAGICAVSIEGMRKLHCEPRNIKVAIGASVGSCCYEVSAEFKAAVIDMIMNTEACRKYIYDYSAAEKLTDKIISNKSGRITADIKRLNYELLLLSGVLPEHIDICELCTSCEAELFYSHRRQGEKRGVNAALIALPPI